MKKVFLGKEKGGGGRRGSKKGLEGFSPLREMHISKVNRKKNITTAYLSKIALNFLIRSQ